MNDISLETAVLTMLACQAAIEDLSSSRFPFLHKKEITKTKRKLAKARISIERKVMNTEC